jgi:hypothetical protein
LPRIKNKVVEQRHREYAKYIAQMRVGVYDWPDGEDKYDSDGCFRVTPWEAYKRCGFDANNSRTLTAMKNSQKIKDMIDLEEVRLRNVSIDHIEKTTTQFGKIRSAAANELYCRLQADPGGFTSADLIRIFIAMEKLERIDLGIEKGLPATGHTTINVTNMNLGLKDKLPPGEFQALVAANAAEKRKQADELDLLVSASRAKDNEDIIEGEVEDDE